MKLATSLLILAMSGCALAQAPANKPAAPANKPATTAKPAATSVKPASAAPAQATPAKATPAPSGPAVRTRTPSTLPIKQADSKLINKTVLAKPARIVKKGAPATPAAAPAAAAPEEKKSAEPTANAKNRRDPFVSVVMSREGPACTGGGKKCLAIDQVTLQGVVRSPNGSIAVVSSGGNKTYFLRENDPVYNGVVVKIAPDSIIFRETVMDRLGKTSQREVVKKIRNTPSV